MRYSLNILFFSFLLTLFCSCSEKKLSDKTKSPQTASEIQLPEYQAILDSAKVTGSLLVYDLNKDTYYSNDIIEAKKGRLPASTYKIPHSIIALELGVVENEQTLFEWNGEPRALKNWEQDLTLKEAFHYSCVPCYQEVARTIGVHKMNSYLDQFEYADMRIDSSNIDQFWLEGTSRISPHQQILFLKRFYQAALPISARTHSIMKDMMVMDKDDKTKLSGKTGWSVSKGINNGWIVGYLETTDNVYFFATSIEPTATFNMDLFASIRKVLTMQAIDHLRYDRN